MAIKAHYKAGVETHRKWFLVKYKYYYIVNCTLQMVCQLSLEDHMTLQCSCDWLAGRNTRVSG